MMADLIRHISQAAINPSDIVIVGMVHSHPSLPGFMATHDPDIDTFNFLAGSKTWQDKGAVPMNFQHSYIWGPRSAQLGGLDPTGQLYSYPPN